ncbi:MAG: aminoacyl-tRNA hydrolase [Mycoplasmatales bacterium]|nr:aminoacyl-tRNA hydrolase [Mycoplasmatales bacterium]
MKLIVGLGNPGEEYEATRHNLGFKVIDAFSHKHGLKLKKKKYTGIYYKGEDFILAKPLTFMNLSGNFVQPIAKFYKIKTEDILIVYDDMDLPVGSARIRSKGSSGGHNGMSDIILRLGTEEVPRLKVGIGRSKNHSRNHVLGNFTKLQISELNKIKDKLTDTIEAFIEGGVESANKKINS